MTQLHVFLHPKTMEKLLIRASGPANCCPEEHMCAEAPMYCAGCLSLPTYSDKKQQMHPRVLQGSDRRQQTCLYPKQPTSTSEHLQQQTYNHREQPMDAQCALHTADRLPKSQPSKARACIQLPFKCQECYATPPKLTY